ncbi:dGTPase [Bacterioplanoides sp.]|uniref:dGTPase n=1 Tax=Bacterioplanoides sp. TaxID=2066072 RepID=UPI003AFF656C
MDYSNKLKTNRVYTSSYAGRDFNHEMESDRGRALTSAAVRRLQQKTQVFPLETNAAVRSRLTHSLEVLQVGRYIGKKVLEKLEQKGRLDEYYLTGVTEGFISAIEIACLLHDIGNPPFGHFGEEAISLWVGNEVREQFDKRFHSLSESEKYFQDLAEFEGNAQGIRILHSLQTLNLTYTQLACLLKYTRPAYEQKPTDGNFVYRKKKAGFYLSEKNLVQELNSELSISEGCRFPLTYIMEAADDISYCIADLDDALDKGILTVESLHQCISDTWHDFADNDNAQVISQRYLPGIAEQAFEKYEAEEVNKNHAYILKLRTSLINDLAEYAANRYIENHQAVFDGSFDEPLIHGKDEYYYATETLRKIAVDKVFSSKEVEALELKGYAVISGLLKIYSPLMNMSFADFSDLSVNNFAKRYPIETRLYHKLSEKHKRTYRNAIKGLDGCDDKNTALIEYYHRVRLIIDYVSGMTDHFAVSEYQELSGAV